MINTSDTDLSAPATPALVDALYAAGHLDRESHDRAMAAVLPPRQWGLWTSRLLLAVGMALVLTGIVFFFAYNWYDIPPFAKLGGIQVLIAGFTITALMLQSDTLPARMMLLAASVMVGVFLAVFGQIYQTGADAWQLFAAWAALSLIWTVFSRFAPQWVFWLVIANIATMLWWQQNGGIALFIMPGTFMILMLFNLPVLALFEALQNRPADWRQKTWIRPALVVAIAFFAAVPAIQFSTRFVDSWEMPKTVKGVGGLLLLICLFLFYRFTRPAIMGVAPVLTALTVTLIFTFGSLVEHVIRWDIPLLAEFIMLVIVLLCFAGLVQYLRNLRSGWMADQ